MKITNFIVSIVVMLGVFAFIPSNPATAWSTNQGSSSYCSDSNSAVIDWSFTNTEKNEPSLSMDVVVKDNQTGVTSDKVTVPGGQTAKGTIDTGESNLGAGTLTYTLTWTDGRSGIDTRTSSYDATECTVPEKPIYECTALSVVRDSENNKKFTFTTETVKSDDVMIEKYVYDFGLEGENPLETDQATVMKIYEDAGEYNVTSEVHFLLPNEETATSTCKTTVNISEDPEEPETPAKTLPATGPASAIAAVAGMSTLGYGAISFRSSRKALKDKILNK